MKEKDNRAGQVPIPRVRAADTGVPAPEKHDGPQHGTFSKDEVLAAGLLHAPPGDGTAPERARKMATLQQRMGNARLSRLLRETGVAPVHEVEPSEVPKRQ
jgi:hypothetical protein